jgi:CheY-like chemotaxis protein
MVVGMLHSLGAKSIQDVVNGKEALAVMNGKKGKTVDVVICDLNMPVMDGVEFLGHLGQINHKASIILFSSTDSKLLSSAGKMTKLYGLKLLGVIVKPIIPEQLEELLLMWRPVEKETNGNGQTKNSDLKNGGNLDS